MKMDAFSGIVGFGVVVALLWGAAVVREGRGFRGRQRPWRRRPTGPAMRTRNASRAGSGGISHVCVPAALELLEAARAQSMAGPVSRKSRADAMVRIQSSSEYLGRILALCDLTGHTEACVAVEPVIELYGGAPSSGESKARRPSAEKRAPRLGITVRRS